MTFPFTVGGFRAAAMNNQMVDHDKSLFRYKDSKELKKLMAQKDSNRGSMNYFFVDTGKYKILFDTGLNASIIKNLEEIGTKPGEIDIICLTHMHPDHVGGLWETVSGEAVPLFPNAMIYVAQEELAANKNSPMVTAYHNKIIAFEPFSPIANGVKSEPAFGHTPGHTVYWVEDSGQKMLIWGDTIHAEIQLQNPEVYLAYDVDPEMAMKSRKNLLERVAGTDTIVAGMHLVYPSVGKILREGKGYKFEPLSRQ